MERVNQARAAAGQQEGASTLRRSAAFPNSALDETADAGALESGPGFPQLTHHPSRFTIYPSVAPGPVPYRAGMERAFAVDLSAVRAYCGASALLTDSGARAAAWPETLVFASPQPSPPVVAHEIAHILQYRRAASPSVDGRTEPSSRHEAEQEAGLAAAGFQAGVALPVQARSAVAPLFYTDEEEPDSEEFLADRPPLFAGQEVGTWGSSWPASLIARERLAVNVPATQRSHAIVEAIARREPIVILHEYDRLWLYRLTWEGLSGRYSRFTNAETLFHEGTNERGNYSVSNVQGRAEVEAFVTEDGEVLSPPGAGKLFSHTGGEFEDPLVSKVQNASAFVNGMLVGLEGANVAALAARLRRMAALNMVFPTPFAIGAVRGLVDEMLELVQLLNPQQWVAIEAAARETILVLSDPDGEELAASLGEEFGRSQAAALDHLLQQSLPIFAYEVGKLIGPTIIELLLALVGIEIGPVAMLQKSLAAMKQVPRVAGMVRDFALVFPDLPDTPAPSATRLPDKARGHVAVPDASTNSSPSVAARLPQGLPNLTREEQALLARTGNQLEFPDALPQDLADQELAIVKRSTKLPISGSDGKYVNEVDLGNGHQWREQSNGAWCRFSDGPTNCTALVPMLGPVSPGTIVAKAADRESLLERYTAWAANRGADEVEVAILKAITGTGEYPAGTYAVVVGSRKGVIYPGNTPEVRWLTISHVHPGVANEPGYRHPSLADLEAAEEDTIRLGKLVGGVRKWIHFQTPEGSWNSVKYGYDATIERYFVEIEGEDRLTFERLHDVTDDQLREYDRLDEAGLVQERIKLMQQENSKGTYLRWYAEQFSFMQ
ncbi:DUF4157 domain-containing protein [Nitrospira defluvii]|uniref:eCIS core domain-containing protein n=1 Tax=Nitrospira defluvii TaxID=330214 RepID=A0ABN7M8U0_9BACT|nr:DUF4157 domain-containing protein [Nitrospira defluvii]CAE6791765.1 conserved hypothetical protein [Nitrospira defluvii]